MWSSTSEELRFQRLFAVTTIVSAALFCALYGASGFVTGEALGERATRYFPFLLCTALFSAIASYFLASMFKLQGCEGVRPLPIVQLPALRLCSAFFVTLIAARVLGQWNGPLHWEDNFHLSNLLVSTWERLDPTIKTEHHTLASLATFLSIKALGLNKVAIQLPAALFALLFLGVAARLTTRYFSTFTWALVFLHLAVNETSLWYMHSMRGYIAAMAFSALALLFTLKIFYEPEKCGRGSAMIFVAIAYAAVFTHLFAALFIILLFISAVMYSTLHRNELTPSTIKILKSIGVAFLAGAVPVFGYMFVFQALWLERLGDFFKPGFPEYTYTLLKVIGFPNVWAGKILVLGSATLLLLVPRVRNHFLTLFLTVSLVFFATVMGGLGVRLLETRFLLPYLLPFLLWVGTAVSQIPHRGLRRVAKTVTLALLIVGPWTSGGGIRGNLTLNVQAFDLFVGHVRHVVNLKKSCFTYSGEPNLIYFSETLYLKPSKRPGDACPETFHVFFESPSELVPIDTRIGKPEPMQEIYSALGHQGRMTLYKVRS